nr:MAG TPA: polyVal ADP-Ribosyltransferase [Caudoviricetes sp.]
MAVDYEKLRKKAKKRDEEKQKKDAYEYSRSMYEGAKKNRSNVSANTYKLYYDDYIKNTKAYKNEQKKGINDERKSQLKAVLNMINPLDSVSASEAKKNYKSAQKEKEKKQSAYDKLKEEYEALNGSKQKKNLLMSEIGKVGETLYGNPYDAERKNEVKQIYNKSKQEAYEQQAYDADIKQKAREETAAKNKSALSKDKEISKKAEQAYKFKNAIVEKNKASGADDMSSAMLNAMGVGSKGQNDVDYSKKYNDSLKELQSLINKKGYKDIKAEDLIDYYVANKNNEQQAKVIKGAEKAAQEHPVIMQAARTLTSPLRAQANIANTIDMAVNGKSSINGTADFITNAAYGTRKGLEDKAANDGLINLAGKKIGPISVNKNNEIEILGNNMGNVNAALYDNIDQMAENVYNSLLFGGGITGGITASGKAEKAKQALINGVFSTAAMGDDMSSQLASGSSSGETIKSSVKSALINFLTEMVGAPLEWADVKGNSTFGKILVSGLNEGTEEIIGNVVDRTYDQITQGQLSELSQLKRSYLEQGLSEQEADKEVVKSMLAEDIFAALQAGFAGAVMSGSEIAPNKIIESAQNNIDNKKLGAEAKAQSNSDIQAIIDEGLSKNKNSKAYKYAEELQAKVKKSQAKGDVLAGTSIYDEADYSKLNEKRLGQLQSEIVKEGFKENIATAIEGEKNEDRINKAISKMVNGFELSRYDVKVIKDSEKAINAINEQFGSDFTEKDISNDSLEALSAKLKNGYTDYSFTYGGYSKYQQRAENAQNAVLEENTPNVSEYTQKPVETFTAEQQSNNPKYNVNAVAITADGNQAEVKIYGKHPFEVSADRSNFKVKTSAGDIDYNNISFKNQTQQVLTNEIINKNFGNSGANAVYVNFDPNNLKGASVSTYVSQAKMLYDLGVAKPDVSFNEFVMRNPAFYSAVKFLGDKAINIYRSGQTDAKSYDTYIEEQRKNKKSPTKTTRHIEGEYKNISDSDSTIDDVFTEVARKTRVDIERHSDGRQGGNGQFIPSLAKIIINADGSGEYNALIHELGEFGLAYNEQEYKNVQSAIRDWYVSYKGADNFNALVDAYIDTYTKAEGSKTRAEAIDELTNDAVSGLFSTDEGVEQFAKWLSDNKTEAEKKSIIETIADFLKSVIEKIKSVIATSNLQTAAKDAMEMEQKRANHIRKQFLNMLDNASNNLYNGTEIEYDTTSIKFSRNIEEYPYDMQTVIKDYLNSVDEKMLGFIDEFNSTKKFARHTISEVNKKQIKDLKKIIGFDFTGYSNGINTNALKHIEKRHGKNGKADNSMKNKNDLARINYILENYDNVEVVDKSSKEFNNSNNKSAQIILFKKKINGTYYLIESAAESKWKKLWVISAYINKNDTVTQVLNDAENVPQSYVRNELASPVSNDNVTQNKASVNNNETKFSLDVDSDGNKLTQQQAEYFKNSKVRDEDGNLLKVYHGTSESFTVFDKTKGRANMDIQGMFFSPWELDAKGYGENVNAYYINITNPASEQMGYKALRKFQGQNNAGVKAREYLESLGYDGVNNGDEEYIAFNSNQIKLADNLTPTENEDIRFSRDVNYSYNELIKKPDMKITEIDDSIDYKANSISRKNVIETAINNAKEIGRVNENGNVVIYVDDIKTDIIVSKSAIRHSLDRRLSINAPVVINVGNILKNSIRINELVPRNKYIENSYALIGIAKNNNNEPYVVSFVVNRHSNEIQSIDVLYAVNAKKEVAALDEPEFRPINGTALTTSTISISNLLDYVNNYFPDILPESVLKHYGYSSRPEGNIGESALFSRDVDYADYAELKRENKHLKEINEVLKHQFELTNGREVSTNSLLIAARKIIKLTPTRMTGVDVAKEMKSWHTLDTSQQFFNAAYDLANKLVENEKQIKYQPTQEEQEMLDYLKNTEIKLSDKQKEEVSYYFGTYGKYKNAARGKINITENGIPLDDLANEMEELFGGLMPSDNSQDMPIALLDMVNTYKDKVIENDYGYSKEEYLESLANDILSYYFKTNLYETKADKNEKRFLKARSKYAQQISDYQKLLADEKAKHKKEFSEFRKEQIRKNQDYRSNLYRDTVEYKAEYRQHQKEKRERSLLYKSFQKSTIRLAQLAKQDKKNHIPNNIVEAVKGIVNVISFGTKLDDKIYSKLYALDRSFKSLNNNDDYEKVTEAYNGYIRNYIEQLQTMIGDRNANQLTLDELKMVDDLVRTTVQVCNNVNKIFYSERNKTIEQSVSKVEEELKQVNAKYKIDKGIIDSIKYGSMKPEYFFEYLGSDELLKLYRDVRKGEDTWAVTIDNSKNYADDVRKKYDWKSWDRKKRYDITTSLGDKLNLNLEQLMAIYAMSNRKQTLNHIIHGGIVVTDKPKSAIQTLKDKSSKWNDSLTHRLSYSDISKIRSMLSDEQRNYVRDMVKYLSTDMAEKGNEISRRLYDVELFKEENYYPARTAKNYMHRSSMETIGAKKIINSGFTNAIVEKAKNPLLLEEFDNVWASHVDEMASYNAFALPLENFDRVYNYHSSNGDEFNSIRTLVENAYGKKATGYISDLLEDLNGGVVHEAGSDIVDKLTSMFKKNAVFASASVAIQQPSAIGRALSIIDTKYFAKTTFTKRSYDEIKKYAPVAIIKEMGYFDTNMAQSTVDYLNNIDYKGLEKVPAFFKDGAFRDEVFGYTASKADEITWSHIWNACKAEAKDKYPNLSTEESLQKAGERFTEVITKTQVYDSVFSRSALMRSKNGAVKMATAFMAEPTTSLNMLFNAAVQAKRGKFSKGKATRIVASLVIASVINALLQSIVTAARNDDDDKTYLEAYLAELIPNFIDNANPVNQIAFVKDVANIFKGYDVTRADMDSVGDLVSAVKNLWSDNLTPWKKVQNIAGALGTFIGWPIENVMRDVRSVYNMVHKGLTIGLGVNKSALKSATMDGIKESLVTDDVLAVFGLDLFPEKDKQQMIYEAIMDGNNDMYKRIADNVSNPDNYIKKGLIENDERVAKAGLAYLDGDIGTAINTAKELESDGFDYELAYKAIKAYSSEIQKAAGYKADSDDKKYKQSLETLISSGTDKETVEKAIDTVEIDEEQDSKDIKFFTNNDLATAIYKNDLSTLKEMVEKNKQVDISNGKSKEEAEDSAQNSIKSALVKGKKEIAQAGIDYSDNNIKAMIDVADELENNYEYTTVIKAIKSYYSTMKSAKEALDDKDDDTYNQKLKELIASGMDKSTVESAIKKIVVTDSDSQNESQLFNEDDLSAAIESGDNNTLNKVCENIKNVYIANGSSKDEAEEKLQKKIKKAKYGKRKTTNVLNANNTQQIRSYINEKVNSYVDSGKSVKQSANYTRKSIDGILELRYKKGNADKKADVLTIMVKTGLYGDRRAAKQYADEHYLK